VRKQKRCVHALAVAQDRENSEKIAESAMPAAAHVARHRQAPSRLSAIAHFPRGFLAFREFDSLAAGLLGAK